MTTQNITHNLLFVYGTLQIKGNHFADFLNKNAQFVSAGKLKGELFDLGNYPGAVYAPDSDSYVKGMVFELENPDLVLRELDFYEGIGSSGCEYVREIVPIVTVNEIIECWVYLFILSTGDNFKINDGDYLRYLNEMKK